MIVLAPLAFIHQLPGAARSLGAQVFISSSLRASLYCDPWAQQLLVGSAVAPWGLSGPKACGILVPLPSIEPASLVLEGGFLTTGPPGRSLFFFFLVLPLYCYQPISLHPHVHMLSHVTPWTAACQAPLSMDFSRQEYWSGLPFPFPPCILFIYAY